MRERRSLSPWWQLVRFRRRKRRVFSLAVGGTVGMVAALLGASDLSWAAGPLADPATIASGLLLSALFGLCWISTDSPLAVFDRV